MGSLLVTVKLKVKHLLWDVVWVISISKINLINTSYVTKVVNAMKTSYIVTQCILQWIILQDS